MVLSIRQHATLPTLKMRLYRDGRNDYHDFNNLIENAVITFAMKDTSTGIYQVANKAASIVLMEPCNADSKKQYYIEYVFTAADTARPGIFMGEFKITFMNQSLDLNGELIMPIGEELYIHVLDSFVKSDVTYLP